MSFTPFSDPYRASPALCEKRRKASVAGCSRMRPAPGTSIRKIGTIGSGSRPLSAARIRDFRFHDLRHTTATRLGKAGVRTRDIATALGHADERMAQRYEHAASVDGHMLDVMQKLSRTSVAPETMDNRKAADGSR